MLIDTHCHLFSKEMLAEEFLRVSNNFQDLNPEMISKRFSNADVMNVLQFISHGIDNDCFELYTHMRKSYGQDFIAVPLMLDLTYTNVNPFLKTDSENTEKLMKISKTINEKFLKAIESFSGSKSTKLYNLFEKVQFKLDSQKKNIFKDNYDIQIQDLTNLKKALPNRVFPFFSVDPRRDSEFDHGVLGEIKKHVGKRKPFTGLKLYTGLGYSPTNPVLYDNSEKQSVYGWCQLHRIPITVHCGYGGFSHTLERNIVHGDIFYPNAGEVIPMENIDKDLILKYEHGILNFDEMVKERQLYLNHPKLWRKVLDKYPRLIINFAHMGGNYQVAKYASGSHTGYWTKQILDIVYDYKYAYTDLSFMTPVEEPKFDAEILYNNIFKKLPKKVKKKILWGSDFFMLDLAETDLSRYLEQFKLAFGKDFVKIAHENPRRFLRIKPQ